MSLHLLPKRVNCRKATESKPEAYDPECEELSALAGNGTKLSIYMCDSAQTPRDGLV
jgi:hypothetical protein